MYLIHKYVLYMCTYMYMHMHNGFGVLGFVRLSIFNLYGGTTGLARQDLRPTRGAMSVWC